MHTDDQPLPAAQITVAILGQGMVEAFDIAAGHEMLAGASDHHTTYRAVVLTSVAGSDQRLGHTRAQRVENRGPVESQDGNPLMEISQHFFVAHRLLRCAPEGARSRRRHWPASMWRV